MENSKRFEEGLEKLLEVDGDAGVNVVEKLGDLGKYVVEFAFGDIYCRKGLSLRDRELATIAILASKSGCEPQLEVHINGGLNVGLSKEEIEEVIIHTVPYAGFPTAINAMGVLKKVISKK